MKLEKMQLGKWLYSKNRCKVVALFLVALFCGSNLNAQDIIKHKVQKNESVYKLAVMYATSTDSIIAWNKMISPELKEGRILVIKDYFELEEEELKANEFLYYIEEQKAYKRKSEASFNQKIAQLEIDKASIDNSKPSAMQQFFDIARLKKLYTDSISIVNDNADKTIISLENEKAEWDALFEKNHTKKFKKRMAGPKYVMEKWPEEDYPTNIKEQNEVVAKDENPVEDVAEKEVALKLQKEQAKKEQAEKEALQALEQERKEKEAAENEKLQAVIAAKEKEEKLKEEAVAEKIKLEIEASLKEEEELKKQLKLTTDSIADFEKEQEKLAKKELTQAEKEMAAMEAAKKKAKDKADGKVDKEALDAKLEAYEENKKTTVTKEVTEEGLEVLKFDVGYKSEVDTTSKKYKKQQEKFQKELEIVNSSHTKDSLKVAKSVTVGEVEIKESKKNKKLKIGDEVDAVRKEKGRFFLARAMVEIDKQNYKKAMEYADKSIALNPNYTEAYMLKGDITASFGYYDKAYNYYDKANQVDANIPQLHYNMGNCLIYLGKKDKALEEMSAAIAIDPEYILAYAGRSALLIEMQKYRTALADYNKILSLNKYFYPALRGRGIAQVNLGNYDEAVRDFNQFLEYEPEDASIYYHRGLAKMYLSEIYGACMDFLSSSERGFSEADKAIKKYCD